jgi:hypothetical protein
MPEKETRTLVKEQAHQEKAFEYYFALGEKRSYAKLAQKFEVSLSTAKLWGRSFRWKERIRERDAQVARELASRAINDEVSRRERSLQIVQLALVQLAKAIAEGKVKMTMGDVDKLIRLEAFLCDLPDSRQEVVFGDLKNKSTEELRAMMREEIEMLKQLEGTEQQVGEWEREGKLLSAPDVVPRSSKNRE